MIMKYGNILNTERKFISTNIMYLNKYLESINKIDDVIIIQLFYNGYKYRKYITSNGCEYTKNIKNGDITLVTKISEKEFKQVLKLTHKIIKKRRRIYLDNEYQVDVDDFEEPNVFTMIEVSNGNLNNYKEPKGFIEVTNMEGYQNKEIFNGFIKKTGIVLEGTDAVGKTETIKKLLSYGIICKDRASTISENMVFDIPMQIRAKKYNEFLKETTDLVLFLINNDKKELLRRVHLRKEVSSFDLKTYEYNQLYKQTYEYMKEHHMLQNKLFLIDCTGLDIAKQVEKVKEVINKYA